VKSFTVLHYTGLYGFFCDLKPVEEAAAMGNFYTTNRFDHISLNVTVMKVNVKRQLPPDGGVGIFVWED
jgi:hypothetical protein